MLLSPIQGGYTLAINLRDIDDSAAGARRLCVAGLDLAHRSSTSARVACARSRAFFELVPGVLLFPFETDLDPMFDAVETARAMVNYDNPLAEMVEERAWLYYNPIVTPFTIRLKFGISYTHAEE